MQHVRALRYGADRVRWGIPRRARHRHDRRRTAHDRTTSVPPAGARALRDRDSTRRRRIGLIRELRATPDLLQNLPAGVVLILRAVQVALIPTHLRAPMSMLIRAFSFPMGDLAGAVGSFGTSGARARRPWRQTVSVRGTSAPRQPVRGCAGCARETALTTDRSAGGRLARPSVIVIRLGFV